MFCPSGSAPAANQVGVGVQSNTVYSTDQASDPRSMRLLCCIQPVLVYRVLRTSPVVSRQPAVGSSKAYEVMRVRGYARQSTGPRPSCLHGNFDRHASMASSCLNRYAKSMHLTHMQRSNLPTGYY